MRINTQNDGGVFSRRLGSNRLAKLLRTIFGRAYYPRTKVHSHLRTDSPPAKRKWKEPTRKSHHEPATSTYLPITTLTNNFPLPLQAPHPWPNLTYFNGQVPYEGVHATQNAVTPQQTWNNHQPTQHLDIKRHSGRASSAPKRTIRSNH